MSATSPGAGLRADSSAAGLKAQLDEVWASFGALGRDISDEEWTLQTACPGWSVAAQYAHVIGTESSLLGRPAPQVGTGAVAHVRNQIGGLNEAWVASFAATSRSDVLDVFDEVTARRREALAGMGEDDFSTASWTPVGEADYRRFMQIRVFDCWVHDQDVRDAVGRPGQRCGSAAEQSVDEIVRATGYVVGKRGGAPAGSSVRIALTGPVFREVTVTVVDGRARVVEGGQATPTVTVTLSSDAFTRLACGRVEPSAVVDGGAFGGVQIAGDIELGVRIARNLAFTI